MINDYEFNFEITTPLEVEESFDSRAVLSGVFLRLNSATKNGNEYQVEEGLQIANRLVGMPVYFGTLPGSNKHDRSPENLVGRVIKAVLDKASQLIKGSVEIFNTNKFPDIVAKVKKGWGFSIGGKAKALQHTGFINELGRAIKRVFGMIPNHLQLLPPHAPRGQDEAQTEEVLQESLEIEESISFDPCPWGVCQLEESGEMIKAEDIIGDGTTTTEIKAGKIEGKKFPVQETIIKRKLYILTDPDSTLTINDES